MQHQMILVSRNAMRDVTYFYLTRDGYRCHSGFATQYLSYSAARERAIAALESAIDEDGKQLMQLRVLSIDAWREPEGGWVWNDWRPCGTVTLREFRKWRHRTALRATAPRWLREHGYLSAGSKGRVTLEDDGYYLTVVDRRTREPLIAIEYGPAYL